MLIFSPQIGMQHQALEYGALLLYSFGGEGDNAVPLFGQRKD
jgi:hypothetical protein